LKKRYPVSGLNGYPTGYPAGNLVSGRISDIKKAGLSGRISGASLMISDESDCLLYITVVNFLLGQASVLGSPPLTNGPSTAYATWERTLKGGGSSGTALVQQQPATVPTPLGSAPPHHYRLAQANIANTIYVTSKVEEPHTGNPFCSWLQIPGTYLVVKKFKNNWKIFLLQLYKEKLCGPLRFRFGKTKLKTFLNVQFLRKSGNVPVPVFIIKINNSRTSYNS
jgi:hypothetical protein